MTVSKSIGGMFWIVSYNGIEIARYDRKWEAKAEADRLKHLV